MSASPSVLRWPFVATLVTLILAACDVRAQSTGEAPVSPPANPIAEATPAPDATLDNAELEPPARQRALFAAEGSFTGATVFGVPITAANVTAMVGGQSSSLAYGVIADFFSGSTEGGLRLIATDLGAFAEGRFGRLRLGGGLRLGCFDADRVTSGSPLLTLSAGIFARTTFDVIDFDPGKNGALYVVLKGGADAIGGPLLAASGGIGVRL